MLLRGQFRMDMGLFGQAVLDDGLRSCGQKPTGGDIFALGRSGASRTVPGLLSFLR